MTSQNTSGIQLLTVPEVARMLNVSSMSIRRWIDTGTMPAVKLGRVYRIHPAVVADLMRQSRTSKPVAAR